MVSAPCLTRYRSRPELSRIPVMAKSSTTPVPGRGSLSNPDNRYHETQVEDFDDGWGTSDETPPRLKTTLTPEASRSIISYNDSPDVPFDRSINPYRGCEHGCIYCYARPTHAWLDLSPGLDFETRLFFKPDAAAKLKHELSRPGYRCAPITLGANTDPYQPTERRLGITRQLLQVLKDTRHPCTLITKSALVERDMDLLRTLAERRLVQVRISVTTLDADLARRLEPRAASPRRRLETIRRLSDTGIPVGVLVAPVIPGLTDAELERILEQTRCAGAAEAAYIWLRLPREVKPLFEEWLDCHAPLQARRVMQRLRDSHNGRAYRAEFGSRMRGEGEYAALIGKRFRLAHARLGFPGLAELDTAQFQAPDGDDAQLALF